MAQQSTETRLSWGPTLERQKKILHLTQTVVLASAELRLSGTNALAQVRNFLDIDEQALKHETFRLTSRGDIRYEGAGIGYIMTSQVDPVKLAEDHPAYTEIKNLLHVAIEQEAQLRAQALAIHDRLDIS
jgi:hypothetical protein